MTTTKAGGRQHQRASWLSTPDAAQVVMALRNLFFAVRSVYINRVRRGAHCAQCPALLPLTGSRFPASAGMGVHEGAR